MFNLFFATIVLNKFERCDYLIGKDFYQNNSSYQCEAVKLDSNGLFICWMLVVFALMMYVPKLNKLI